MYIWSNLFTNRGSSESWWRTKTISEGKNKRNDVHSSTHMLVLPPGIYNSPWAWYYTIVYTELEVWLRLPHPEPLTKWSDPQGRKTIRRSHDLLGSRWLIAQFTHPSDEAGHSEFPVRPYSIDADEHTAVWFLRCPWLIWIQGLAIVTNQSMQWKASDTCLRSPFSLGTPPREFNAWGFLSRGYLKRKSFGSIPRIVKDK